MSHFSFGSGGGVPAIGCGLGRVTVPRFVVFADKRGSEVVNVAAAAAAAAATTALEAEKMEKNMQQEKDTLLKIMKIEVLFLCYSLVINFLLWQMEITNE